MTADPSLYQKTDADRITFQQTQYSFKDLGNGQTEITIDMKNTPPYEVPSRLIKAGFPGEPVKAIKNFILAAKSLEN